MPQQHLDLFKWTELYIASAREEHPICCISPPVHHKVHVRAPHGRPPTMLGSFEVLIIHIGRPRTPHRTPEQTRTWSNNKEIPLDSNFHINLCHTCRMCMGGFEPMGPSAEAAVHPDVGALWRTPPFQSKLLSTSLIKLCSSLWKVYRTLHKKDKELLRSAPEILNKHLKH